MIQLSSTTPLTLLPNTSATLTVKYTGTFTAKYSGAKYLNVTTNVAGGEGTIIITASGVGDYSTTILFTDDDSSAKLEVTILPTSTKITLLTADGSGGGNDATMFGRQYIIANNQNVMYNLHQALKTQLNVLSGMVAAGVIADLGETIATLQAIKHQLDDLELTVEHKTKNVVHYSRK